MNHRYDVIVIGSGPAGQKAAIQLAKAGRRVALCEQLKEIGGACVHQGTIPSKALRERAEAHGKINTRLRELGLDELHQGAGVSELIGEMTAVVSAHDRYMTAQLERNQIDIVHGRARFVSANEVDVLTISGQHLRYQADNFVIATGSKPRDPEHISIDHEHVYDSDSVLTLAYLPQSMIVLGGGVIACEYASIFAMLGVRVTLVDRYPRPLGFLDEELTTRFVAAFERLGGVFLGEVDVKACHFDGVSQVETHLADGAILKSDKVLCAQGRIAVLDALQIDKAGLSVNDRGLLSVDEHGRTAQPHIYAAGDAIGPPSLASASMEQGRRAALHMLGRDVGALSHLVPTGIYAIPELAAVGLTEAQAREQFDQVVVGLADFREIARGHIADAQEGVLKLVVSGDGVIRGVHIVGAHATDLVHIGQMGMINGMDVWGYIENVFNFPTYAESYRVAALSAASQLPEMAVVSQGVA